MKRVILPLLAAAALLLTGCSSRTDPIPESTLIPGTDVTLPTVSRSHSPEKRESATLWFRFLDEPFLAAETRTIVRLSGQSYEMALLTALFDGPGTQYVELQNPFPDGARVLSTVRQGRRLLVTVSSEFLNPMNDEPPDWQSEPVWQVEVPLRRMLCMQAVVATVTENCDVDEVIVLVDQREIVSNSMRLKQSWFMTGGDDDAIAPAQTRRDEYLLTAQAAADAVLTCWTRCDWERLWKYVSVTDPYTGEEKPDYRSFVARMQAQQRLSGYVLHGCSVRDDGAEATASATILLQEGGAVRELTSRCLRLHRDGGIWKIGMSGMLGWLEE